jgi:pyridoxine kinase
MKRVFMISSFVAGSNVGGSLAMKVLPLLGCELSLLPTTMLGRHPGWGAPGGGAVTDEMFSSMAEGLVANGAIETADCIVTGYFASAAQVSEAARLISVHKTEGTPVIVDAVMGDFGKGLYVREEVAAAIVSELLPLADIIKSNAWEFWEIERRKGRVDVIPEAACEADVIKSHLAGDFRLSALQFVSSVEQDDEIGLLGVSEQGAFWSGHARANGEHVPNGFGDFLTVLLARDAVGGLKPVQKMLFNEMTVFAPVFGAHDLSEPSEFDIGVLPKALGKPKPARVIPL